MSKKANLVNTWAHESTKSEVCEMASKEDLTRIMECPYCFEVPVPPVSLCLTGHLVCSSCRGKQVKCGLCVSPFVKTRNFFYESVFDKTIFRCKYAVDGCKETLTGSLLKAHQENCDFRPIPCISHGCVNSEIGKFISFSMYEEHLKEEHLVLFNKHQSESLEYAASWKIAGFSTDDIASFQCRSLNKPYHFNGFTFFINCHFRKPEVGIWLWLIGTAEEAKKFKGIIILGTSSSVEKGATITTWEGPVHSIQKRQDTIMDGGMCFSTTLNAFKALCRETTFGTPFWEISFKLQERNLQDISLKPISAQESSVPFQFQPIMASQVPESFQFLPKGAQGPEPFQFKPINVSSPCQSQLQTSDCVSSDSSVGSSTTTVEALPMAHTVESNQDEGKLNLKKVLDSLPESE